MGIQTRLHGRDVGGGRGALGHRPVVSGHPVSLPSFLGDHSDIHVPVLPTIAEEGVAPSSGLDRSSVAAHLAEHHAAYLLDEDDEASSWYGVEDLEDQDLARRDEECDARCVETSDEDMPPLGSGTSTSDASTETSDHYRGEPGTDSDEYSYGDESQCARASGVM